MHPARSPAGATTSAAMTCQARCCALGPEAKTSSTNPASTVAVAAASKTFPKADKSRNRGNPAGSPKSTLAVARSGLPGRCPSRRSGRKGCCRAQRRAKSDMIHLCVQRRTRQDFAARRSLSSPTREGPPSAWPCPLSASSKPRSSTTRASPRSASSAARCWRSLTVRPTRGGRDPPTRRHDHIPGVN